ncbi:hypothetical protein LPJ78_002451 [Coemansia sp. RSA 989]|nr:hypothetical protein BX667DRAFT_500747 [Coemansia mojavensis]KAJ1740153.1 hypothetical protein LPJ68_004026 [Coemansia sp. RSA 1086]KAJ1748579.1 hypothetical protein LPJ79_004419 [Coemansia sp. RSA 1821]KAJ1865763.1 hypothetical protein LPJ78_002451 [Coemansia sp. RSA 989]KAJ1873684.1 hypothetical protein LPJ55_002135 [Coemansia sp. RSA 990]KAJ2648800.1 hypothetical protein IWW40_003600 [Coemansia sp. RSA 1250]KAJ2671408.1 hypothetical protein IWW42_003367 [Coemansia sp. RSA 1085]
MKRSKVMYPVVMISDDMSQSHESDWQDTSTGSSMGSRASPTPPESRHTPEVSDSDQPSSTGTFKTPTETSSSESVSPKNHSRGQLRLRRSARKRSQADPYTRAEPMITRSQRASNPPAALSSGRASRKRRVMHSSDESSAMATSSVASSLDCEVTIYTQGTAVPEPPESRCCICNEVLQGDIEAINKHIDGCLGGNEMVEYEWAGQHRVRTTALVEGGLSALGLVGSSRPSDEEVDDIDVDTRDEMHYGAPQYSDSDLVLATNQPTSHVRRPSDPQFEFTPTQPDPSADEDSPREQPGGSPQQLLIEALKSRIREQDRQLQRVPKCPICQSLFKKPCTSINCWHVFCESCWMHSLGAKKLCPQCQQITQPQDLRRIFM